MIDCIVYMSIYRTRISKQMRLIIERQLRAILFIYKGKSGNLSSILLPANIDTPQGGT